MNTRKAQKLLNLFPLILILALWLQPASADMLINSDITTNTIWKTSSSPYIIQNTIHVESGSSCDTKCPVLTIQPGVVVKFNPGAYIVIGSSHGGGLQAIGTITSRISFQPNSATPTIGYYGGLSFGDLTYTTSAIAYADFSYASTAISTGLNLTSVHHTTFQSNRTGISYRSSAPIAVYENVFLNNTTGAAAGPNNCRFAWWNSTSGPPTGVVWDSISYEPWLLGMPSTAQYFTGSFTSSNSTFNPSIGINSHIQFQTALTGSWTVRITNSGNQIVRTFTGSGSNGTVVWDGKNTSGALQPNGTYYYQIDSTGSHGEVATSAMGRMTIDTTKQFTISNLSLSAAYISPNGDGNKDITQLLASINYPDATWILNIKNSAGSVVRTATGTNSLNFVWDGKNGSQQIVPDGVYTFQLTYTDDAATASSSPVTTVDNTLPAPVITAPVQNTLVSNFYQGGSDSVSVTGNAGDVNFGNWLLSYGAGTSPTAWVDLSSNASSVNVSYNWLTSNLGNGTWTLRLFVNDLAANQNFVFRTITIGNFTVRQNAYQLDSNGGLVNYTSQIPFSLRETLLIKNPSGQTVRTLLNNTLRTQATYTDTWDGKSDSGVTLPDGPYSYTAAVTDGTTTMNWDLTAVPLTTNGDTVFYLPTDDYDPWNNQPLELKYTLQKASRMFLAFSSAGPRVLANCNPNVCIMGLDYQEAGPHIFHWAQVDNSGVYRPDLKYAAFSGGTNNFSQNTVLLFGSKPKISNLKLLPPLFFPYSGPQNITFDLVSYQNQAVNITVTFFNHTARATLRTMVQAGVTPGTGISLPWDGKADNGNYLAPGGYTVTVTASDAVGNSVSEQILTRIRY
ncbi:MAG: hypothetical protein C5B54_06220 [Acidobacteria bacterium]|nr:MAG: hypothetical protein C5B54_06220 [Acidobacteriota bacterium]